MLAIWIIYVLCKGYKPYVIDIYTLFVVTV